VFCINEVLIPQMGEKGAMPSPSILTLTLKMEASYSETPSSSSLTDNDAKNKINKKMTNLNFESASQSVTVSQSVSQSTNQSIKPVFHTIPYVRVCITRIMPQHRCQNITEFPPQSVTTKRSFLAIVTQLITRNLLSHFVLQTIH
jgi:hypothetical protein